MGFTGDTSASLREAIRHFGTQPERSLSLPPQCYTAPEFATLEREQIFLRTWQFLCHGEKLRAPGSYVTTDWCGRSIVATHAQDGVVRAFYNVCRHRGHALVQGDGRAQRLTCPYHAWSFGLDGALRTAPGTECLPDFRREDYALVPVAVECFAGLWFFNLDPAAESLASTTGDLAAQVRRYAPDLDRLTFAHRLSYTVQANW